MKNRPRQSKPGLFIKEHGEHVATDFLRVQRLWETCCRVDGLVAPRPIWMDEQSGRIAYEWLPGLQSLMRPLTTAAPNMRLVGQLLARLHLASREDMLADASMVPVYTADEFGLSVDAEAILDAVFPTAMFHGDCWHGNMFTSPNGELVILDPIPNPWLFDQSRTLACSAVDLAMMHMSIFLCHSAFRHLTSSISGLRTLADDLVSGYLGEIRVSDDGSKRAVMTLSRVIALRHVAGYAPRLAWPVATIKSTIGRKLITQLDGEIQWNR